MGRSAPGFESGAMEILMNYSWPGNIRQLQNVAQRILFFSKEKISKDSVISAIGMKMTIEDHKQPYNFDMEHILPLKEIERQFRKDYFKFVRSHCKTDAEASQKLDLAPPNYFRISKELGLK
jgi:DNA-binding NtrC family response regulator